MTTAVQDALAEGTAQLYAAGIESARLDARVLLAAAIQVSPDSILTSGKLQARDHERFAALLTRRAAREPLAYVTGQKEFWSLPFAVGPGVLIPRPETETLVEAALQRFGAEAPLRVLDIGTGSGCLLISFLRERPEASGVGIDLSESALVWARRNALALGVASRCRLELADGEPADGDRFDVVLANPPYLRSAEFEASAPEIQLWEPACALLGGEDGFVPIRAVGSVLARRLAEGGRAFVEVGAGQAAPAAEILTRSGLDVHEIIADLSGIPRCLVAGQAGSGGK